MQKFQQYPSKVWREWLAAVEPGQTRIANVTARRRDSAGSEYVTFRAFYTTHGAMIEPDPNLFDRATKAQLGIISGPCSTVRWV